MSLRLGDVIWFNYDAEKRYGTCVERYKSGVPLTWECECDPAPTRRIHDIVECLNSQTKGGVHLIGHSAGTHKVLAFLAAAPSLSSDIAIHTVVLVAAVWHPELVPQGVEALATSLSSAKVILYQHSNDRLCPWTPEMSQEWDKIA